MTYTEQIVCVGDAKPLVGILTKPTQPKTKTRILVLLNSGMLHHVGSCNLSVKIARQAAAGGVTAYRVDFSGIGDSRTRTYTGTHKERNVSEVREVLDALGQQGFTDVWLCGLCAGADAALAAAAVDCRVQGIAQLDPMCYRTRKWYLHECLRKLTSIELWERRFRRLIGKQVWVGGLPAEFLEDVDNQLYHEYARSSLERDYQELVARDTKILVVMTKGHSELYNYEGQFRHVFGPFGDHLQEYFLPKTRHLITAPEDQLFVTELVANWASEGCDRAEELSSNFAIPRRAASKPLNLKAKP